MFSTPQTSITIRQTLVKTWFFHSELGIRAGSPKRSWRCSQKIKKGTRAAPTMSRAIFTGALMLETSLVRALQNFVSDFDAL